MGKSFYRNCFDTVCKKHSLSRTELDVIVFLADNPDSNTATDITQKREIAKSNVSTAIRSLTEKKYIEGYYEGSNRRSVHLRLLDKCSPVIADADAAKLKFHNAVFDGFNDEELEQAVSFLFRLTDNINKAKKEYANKNNNTEEM
ncbi:MAG: winged helix-turn-helix transcriptional regulator [Oscillospiraceae bacterium]|nr:winged helix-turn-helix transcriptional regulator [Oscillospiraceae bacterium]